MASLIAQLAEIYLQYGEREKIKTLLRLFEDNEFGLTTEKYQYEEIKGMLN